jgi:hypothetical protein
MGSHCEYETNLNKVENKGPGKFLWWLPIVVLALKNGVKKKRKLTEGLSSVFQRICLKNFLDGIQDIGR